MCFLFIACCDAFCYLIVILYYYMVYSIIIFKLSTQHNNTCLFLYYIILHNSGALLPYLISWTLYQGKLLITVLNWAGLLVNGTVAFILPLIFIIRTIDRRENDNKRRCQIQQLQLLGVVRNVKWGTLQYFIFTFNFVHFILFYLHRLLLLSFFFFHFSFFMFFDI